MLLFIVEGVASGYQDFPDTSDMPHVRVDNVADQERIRAEGVGAVEIQPDGSGGYTYRLKTEAELSAEREAKALAASQATYEARIDTAAKAARLRYISPDKDATYIEKAKEVDRWVAAGRPDSPAAGEYPYIEKEAQYCAKTFAEVATLIETRRNQWLTLDPLIEGIARGGKVKCESATTSAEIETHVADTVAALDAL